MRKRFTEKRIEEYKRKKKVQSSGGEGEVNKRETSERHSEERNCRKLVWKGTEQEGKLSKGLREKHKRGKTCYTPKPTSRA